MWDLLPGRYASIEQLKDFIGYVSSGWPNDSKIAVEDMNGKVPAGFLDRMVGVIDRLGNNK